LNLKGNYSDKRFWYGGWEVQDKLLHLKWVRCLKLEKTIKELELGCYWWKDL
jgi:hypothetical protein